MLLVQSVTSIADALLAELEIQVPVTRRFLDRLPEDKLTWKPHEKSLTAGQLALHIALVPGNVVRLVADNPRQAREKFEFPQPASHNEILKALDESVAAARERLPGFDDAAMNEAWRLMKGEKEIFSQPRGLFLRDVMFSHWYQHRGQFSVYLRLLGIPVPASWGPSADEPPLFLQTARPA
ncbi:MAG TPA: DinB family protein [Terracidiphilus sp.]|nr:DinB family protein [Terracidiphilus sp.]